MRIRRMLLALLAFSPLTCCVFALFRRPRPPPPPQSRFDWSRPPPLDGPLTRYPLWTHDESHEPPPPVRMPVFRPVDDNREEDDRLDRDDRDDRDDRGNRHDRDQETSESQYDFMERDDCHGGHCHMPPKVSETLGDTDDTNEMCACR